MLDSIAQYELIKPTAQMIHSHTTMSMLALICKSLVLFFDRVLPIFPSHDCLAVWRHITTTRASEKRINWKFGQLHHGNLHMISRNVLHILVSFESMLLSKMNVSVNRKNYRFGGFYEAPPDGFILLFCIPIVHSWWWMVYINVPTRVLRYYF